MGSYFFVLVCVCAEMTWTSGNPWECLNTKAGPLSILPCAFFWKKDSRGSWEKVMSALELAFWYYFLKTYCFLMAVFQPKLMSSYVVKELGTFEALISLQIIRSLSLWGDVWSWVLYIKWYSNFLLCANCPPGMCHSHLSVGLPHKIRSNSNAF